jgi:hypothetical protein
MNMQDEWESEERIAAAADLPVLDAETRDELLASTSGIVRGRRRRRAGAQLAAVVLAFVSGMITMSAIRTPANPTQPSPQTSIAQTPVNTATEPIENEAAALFNDPEAFARVYDAASADERRILLKAAGDHALNERGDLREALSYYQQWLHETDPQVRTEFDGSDTWLLASLKQDQ